MQRFLDGCLFICSFSFGYSVVCSLTIVLSVLWLFCCLFFGYCVVYPSIYGFFDIYQALLCSLSDFSCICDISRNFSLVFCELFCCPFLSIIYFSFGHLTGVRVIVFNATFNNISAISRRSFLLMGETGVPGENHRPAADH